jgi:hypothetical protein
MPHSKETIRAHGQILVDFANAKTTDVACRYYFKNISNFFSFSPSFFLLIQKQFPFLYSFLSSINSADKKAIELINEKEFLLEVLEKPFSGALYAIKECSPKNNSLILAELDVSEDGFFEKGQVPVSMPIDKIREWNGKEQILLYQPIKSDKGEPNAKPIIFIDCVNDLMKNADELDKLKSKIPQKRLQELNNLREPYIDIHILHRRIEKLQNDYRNILDRIIEGAPLNEIPTLAEKFKTIYDVSKMKTTKLIAGRDSFEEIPLIDETNYIRNKINRGWFIELQDEFVHWMVEFFRERHNRKYIKKCPYCGNFFIAGRIDHRIKFCNECSPKSKMSKEARRKYQQEYRRKKRQEKFAIEREARINNIMKKTGYSRKEVIEIIEADSKL